jgi:Lar family restriction alleviation protein
MSTKLLPCPFCGSEPFEYESEYGEHDELKVFTIECFNRNCQASVNSNLASKENFQAEIESVNNKWNRRTNKETN